MVVAAGVNGGPAPKLTRTDHQGWEAQDLLDEPSASIGALSVASISEFRWAWRKAVPGVLDANWPPGMSTAPASWSHTGKQGRRVVARPIAADLVRSRLPKIAPPVDPMALAPHHLNKLKRADQTRQACLCVSSFAAVNRIVGPHVMRKKSCAALVHPSSNPISEECAKRFGCTGLPPHGGQAETTATSKSDLHHLIEGHL